MKKIGTPLVIGVAVVFIIVVIVLANPFASRSIPTSAEEGVTVGKKMPSFSLKDSEGNEVSLSSLEGQNLIINAWAAWCPFCINEMPDLQEAANGNKDVTVVFIHRTATEPFSAGEKFLKEFREKGTPITDPILLDPNDSFYSTFFGLGMPVSIFVDKSGIIKFKKIGPMDVQEVNDKIKEHFGSGEGGSPSGGNDEIKTLPDGTKYIISPDLFLSGGPGKDGIPSIDNPKFISAAEADWLPDEEFGLGIVHKGEARFYPFRILVSHEIVNDFIQGDPVLVTYCPLCFTGISFLSEIDGEAVEFGVSGKLFNSELVMYDRKTDSYWPQSLGKAVVGPSTGKTIKKLPTDTVKWGSWKSVHPETKVLSRDTGFLFRFYDGSNPYGAAGDFTSIGVRFPLQNEDNRLPKNTIVYGIEVNGSFKAYSQKDVEAAGTINDELAGQEVTIEWDSDLGSAKATAQEPLVVETLFWFAWAAFHPDTDVFVPSE